MWRSPVAHSAGGRGVAGSNPVIPTYFFTMPFFAYMIKSNSINKHYYGHTSDLDQRLISHNSSQNKFTRGKGPWELIGYFETQTKAEAINIELKHKNLKSPKRAYSWLKKNGVVK